MNDGGVHAIDHGFQLFSSEWSAHSNNATHKHLNITY
jgi:hypothetical protein